MCPFSLFIFSGNPKNVYSDAFIEFLKNKTLNLDLTTVDRQKLFKRMYHKLEKAEQISDELKHFTVPEHVGLTIPSTIPFHRYQKSSTADIIDQMLNNWEPGNPDYEVCTDHFNFGIPKKLTVVHRYRLPVTHRGMFNLKPIVCEILKKFTHVYEPTSQRPKPTVVLATTTTEKLTTSEEIKDRYNTKELYKRYGVHMSEFTSSDSESKKKTFIKENNTLLIHDMDCSDFFDLRSGVMRRKKFTRPPDSCNKTTLRPPGRRRRKKYWGPRIYEKLRLMNDSKRVKKILSEYDAFMLNRGSSFNFGHDTSKYRKYA